MGSNAPNLTNFTAYVDPETGLERIGHLDLDERTIQPLSFLSGTPIANLYQVIEAGLSHIKRSGVTIPAASIKLLPPISGRDVLAVGKNYMEHAKEFNSSGYDSSDKVDRPSHPVIFTKRATSIIADGEEISTHQGFTETPDYEGEIGVIIGKPGYQIKEQDAWNHVWGYTIINDMTARERQRDHKQFYIGKSPDTFCPMGPIAVPKENLPKQLRVQTFVNDEKRQEATTDDLIFSIPVLVETLSAGLTLQPGDVLATGTPAGVGFGQKPPTFLKPGDEVQINVTGLGTLRNKIASGSHVEYATKTSIPLTNASKAINGTVGLTQINSKFLHYKKMGSTGTPIVFIHGLGGTMNYWIPVLSALALPSSHTVHLLDLEGHGLSPTSPLSVLSIESFATDIEGISRHAGISDSNPAIYVGHSLGCLISLQFALANPQLVKKIVLIGPPPSPIPEDIAQILLRRAEIARTKGMSAIADEVADGAILDQQTPISYVGIAASRLSLLGQDPECYAKACSAIAGATNKMNVQDIQAETLLICGDADSVTPPAFAEEYAKMIKGSRFVSLRGCGHRPMFEDPEGLVNVLRDFI